jgi:hypothetical protein
MMLNERSSRTAAWNLQAMTGVFGLGIFVCGSDKGYDQVL